MYRAPPPPPPFPFPATQCFVNPEHPYMVSGNKYPWSFTEKDGFYYARVDLPGINQESVTVRTDGHYLYFEGLDRKDDAQFDMEEPRKFQGRIPLFGGDGRLYKIDELKYVVKNGLLKVKIPKQARDINVCSRVG